MLKVGKVGEFKEELRFLVAMPARNQASPMELSMYAEMSPGATGSSDSRKGTLSLGVLLLFPTGSRSLITLLSNLAVPQT